MSFYKISKFRYFDYEFIVLIWVFIRCQIIILIMSLLYWYEFSQDVKSLFWSWVYCIDVSFHKMLNHYFDQEFIVLMWVFTRCQIIILIKSLLYWCEFSQDVKSLFQSRVYCIDVSFHKMLNHYFDHEFIVLYWFEFS